MKFSRKIRCMWLMLAFVLAADNTTFAAEADQFEFRGALAFDKAIDVAIAGDRIIVLSPGSLSILDGSSLAPVLNRVKAFSVGREYTFLAADGDIVATATRDGQIEIYQLDGGELAHRANFASPDSIIAMTLVGDVLCLAQGYGGVRVVDVAEPSRPRTMQSLREPDYSQKVDLAGEFLFVLDALNGVTVYAQLSGEYRHLDNIFTDTAPTDISAHQYGVVISYGTRQSEVWNCSVANGATLDWIVETEFPVSLITGIRAIDTMFYLASEMGELAEVGRVTAETSLPYPADKIIAFEQSTLYSVLVLDRAGHVTAFKRNPALAGRTTYDGATMPSAMVAVEGGLVVSTPSGIQMLTTIGSDVDSRTILPGAPITTILAESSHYIFTGSADGGAVATYVNERNRWKEQGSLKTGLTLRKLFIRGDSSDEQDLIAVGEEGIKCYRLEPDGSEIATCSLLVNGRISNADVRDDWLVTTTENGEVNLYAFVQGDIAPVGETRCTARPRDVVVTPEGVVVIAHGGGIEVFEFDAINGELVELETPAAVSSAFDLSYDEVSRELIVASGPTPVKYLDFSDPGYLGTVYLVAGTAGASEIAYREGKLYCQSADWVRVYERSDGALKSHESDATLQAVMAAPNPFNSETRVTIQLSPSARLPLSFEVSFVNVLGQTLSRQEFVASETLVTIDLPQVIGWERVLPSGVYFFVVRTADEMVTRKLLLLK